jgi:hypothetical protein
MIDDTNADTLLEMQAKKVMEILSPAQQKCLIGALDEIDLMRWSQLVHRRGEIT